MATCPTEDELLVTLLAGGTLLLHQLLRLFSLCQNTPPAILHCTVPYTTHSTLFWSNGKLKLILSDLFFSTHSCGSASCGFYFCQARHVCWAFTASHWSLLRLAQVYLPKFDIFKSQMSDRANHPVVMAGSEMTFEPKHLYTYVIQTCCFDIGEEKDCSGWKDSPCGSVLQWLAA